MKRSRLKNKAKSKSKAKTKSRDGIFNYKKQRNLVVKLNKKSKFEYFNKYDPNKQGKPFLVNWKPYFSNKHSKADTKIMLFEDDELIKKKQLFFGKKET